MIAYLSGRVILERCGFIILDVNGIGYKVFVPINLNIPSDSIECDKKIKLFIHQHLREDSSDLYGFLEFQELEIFQKLISVNGVGPKVGLAIISVAESKKIYQAIEGEDLTFFSSIPGIGKKVAAKIILELKSKIISVNGITGNSSSDELFEALASLGFNRSDVMKIIPKIPPEISDIEDRIRWILKNLSK
jgi:Holliday junction DNA helicase RuvA